MAHLTQKHVHYLYDTFGELKVLDDIIQHRAGDNHPSPILGYPRNEDRVDSYEQFTGHQLDHFIDAAVKYFIKSGLRPNTREVVGIFAPSNVDFVVTFFALSRLGYTVLCLSLRLAPVAIVNLLKQTDCITIAHGSTQNIAASMAAVGTEWSINLVPVPPRSIYGTPRSLVELPFVRSFDRESETNKIALIMHSSGSTGLPKPVFLSHKNVLTHPVQGTGMDNFGALPLYHMYGLSTTLQAMYMGKTANLVSATLPMTADNLNTSIETIRPQVIHAVPYALGLIADHPRGVENLRAARIVTAAGARTPDDLGDRLVKGGVNFGVVFGTTEAGLLGDTMHREKEDHSWNYVRIYSNIRESIYMDRLDDEHFEAVYLKSHPGLSTWNSDNPAPQSWRSKDVFVPHPTIPDVWKYVTRLDDRVTLSNGEKVLPLPMEGRIRQHHLIREAIVVGVDRAIPGLLLFKAKAGDKLSDESFLDEVWPVIADGNLRAEAFSQITKEMVITLASNVEYPRTDKGSIIRAQVYRQFAQEIDSMYARLEDCQEGTLQLDLTGIETFLKDTYNCIVGSSLESLDTDFFTAGIDSLKAIQMRRIIQQTLDLNGKQLSSNVVYEQGNAKKLAKHLSALGQGRNVEEEDRIPLMKTLITEYSNFGNVVTQPITVILTGATGSLGAHILAQMANNPEIRKVYCLVRGPNPMERILDSLKERAIELDFSSKCKIVALTAILDQPNFGLGKPQVELFKSEISLIVHLAWPVNFNIKLESFEPHLAGLKNLLTLSLSVHRAEPARLFFASSISAAENTPVPALILDAPIHNLRHASNMGYAQSKIVGEHMVLNAARNGARSYVLRIGQIVGDRQSGIWNDNEYIPSMIRSALSLKALPVLQENCSWLPVDTLATAILELDRTLQLAPRPCTIDPVDPPVMYNMVNPHLFKWDQLLEELKTAGLEFKAVPFADWLQRLQDSASRAGEEEKNPAVKLLDHFRQRYEATEGVTGSIIFDTYAIQRDSVILRSPPNVIWDGYMSKFVSTWLKRWTPAFDV